MLIIVKDPVVLLQSIRFSFFILFLMFFLSYCDLFNALALVDNRLSPI